MCSIHLRLHGRLSCVSWSVSPMLPKSLRRWKMPFWNGSLRLSQRWVWQRTRRRTCRSSQWIFHHMFFFFFLLPFHHITYCKIFRFFFLVCDFTWMQFTVNMFFWFLHFFIIHRLTSQQKRASRCIRLCTPFWDPFWRKWENH